jgi:uncharacterized membrane protein YgcG
MAANMMEAPEAAVWVLVLERQALPAWVLRMMTVPGNWVITWKRRYRRSRYYRNYYGGAALTAYTDIKGIEGSGGNSGNGGMTGGGNTGGNVGTASLTLGIPSYVDKFVAAVMVCVPTDAGKRAEQGR